MTMAQTVDAFASFLKSHNIPTSGVSITFEFDDYGKARYALEMMKGEFGLRYMMPGEPPKQMEGQVKIMSIPVKFTAKV